MPRTSKLNDEKALREAVLNSTTRGEVIAKMGLAAGGGTYKTLKEKCSEFDIDLTHLARDYDSLAHLGRENKTPDELVFCEKSSYLNRMGIKKRMVEDHGIPLICAECGLGDEWNGKPIVLTLEHKNGVNNDNRLVNLCFLCPNCHSQTGTFAGRNYSKSGRFCDVCNTWLPSAVKNCPRGCHKSEDHTSRQNSGGRATKKRVPRPDWEKIEWLPTPELKALAKEHGYRKTGRMLGVSDNAIRKRIRTHP